MKHITLPRRQESSRLRGNRKALGVSHTTVINRMKQLGIP
ncbi:MAG: hypothetical protein ACOX34_02140 [Bacillota bacterium]